MNIEDRSNFKERIGRMSHKERELLGIRIAMESGNGRAGHSNKDGHHKIIAYLVGEREIDQEDLRKYLKSKLPNYMIPSVITQIERLPQLPNGKIDVDALLSPIESDVSDANYSSPKNETEKKIVTIWEEVLNFSPIGTNDNFFEIGGDSLLSIAIISRCRQVGIHFTPSQFFRFQSIAELVESLNESHYLRPRNSFELVID